MSKSLQPITIIASDFCEDIGDSTEFYHARFSKKLLIAYKKLNMYLSPELSVQTMVMPVDGQIELPCDFIYETKIGLLKNGCLVTLDLKKDLRLDNLRYTDSQIQQRLNECFSGADYAGDYFTFYNAFRAGTFLGPLYGIGCGYHANTWYNIHDGILELGSLVPDDAEVVIEYKSDGLKDGFKLVPTEMVDAMVYKAKELFYEDSKPSLAATMKEKYREEYFRLKSLYSKRPPDYLAWLFKSGDRPARY